jgi:hypothetical protein
MPGKTRVSALAKELGITSKQAIEQLTAMGEYVKTASSTIEGPVARRLRTRFPDNGDAPVLPADVVLHRVEKLAGWPNVTHLVRACHDAQRSHFPLVIDFDHVQFMYPNACVPVAATIQHFKQQGVTVQAINVPPRLNSIHLLAPLEATDENLAEYSKLVNTVWVYFDTDEATALTEAIVRHIERTIPMEAGVQQSLNVCLFEIIDNVFEHSDQNSGYFMATLSIASKRLAMAIGDTGIGALNSFRKAKSKHNPENDFDALTLTIQSGVTSTGDTPRGNGLYSLRRTVETNQGRLELRSGTGRLFVSGTSVTGADYASMPNLGRQNRGFFIDWQLDLNREIDLNDVYGDLPAVPVNHLLEAMENDAAEHVVRIRDHERGLGTRRAAEQLRVTLLNKLSLGASRLVLDFEGVAVVGVSFADEVVGKLAEQYGVIGFMQRFELRNVERTIHMLLERAINLRLGALRPDALVRDVLPAPPRHPH